MGTISHEIIRGVLRIFFGNEHYVTMYECIDDDMLRKTAISIKKIKEYKNGDNDYSVRINWQLLDKAIEQIGEGEK